MKRDELAALDEAVFGFAQRRDDLGAATAAAAMTGGPKLLRDVKHALLERLRHELDIFGAH
jgi:hypothetical protein